VLGVLSLVTAESGRRYGEHDLALATELARRAALAIENARLHRTALRARQAAEAAEALLARVLTQAPVAIAVARGPDHVLQIANPRYLSLVGRTALVGRPIREVLPALEGQRGQRLMDAVRATGRPFVGDETPVQLVRDDATAPETCYFNFVLQPLLDDDGTVDGIAIVATDVTEQVRSRQAADEANLAKSQFLAVMSHELRTPLNAIAGYAELLRLGIRGPVTSEQEADLERITRSQRSLLSLINDVLNYAKLEAGHVQFATTRVRMHDVLGELEALVIPQLRAKSLAYDYAACDESLHARADVEKVQQILVNLLSNAIKFTAAGGQIAVACAGDDTRVHVTVRDTGDGIPPDKLGAIFEPFVQLDRKLTSTHEGTGLGLAISRDLARRMGGDLCVDSRLGEGSTFTLTLPRDG
jgi:signal transduction histidine kinase